MFSETITSHTTIVNRIFFSFFFFFLDVGRLADAMVYFRKERNLEGAGWGSKVQLSFRSHYCIFHSALCQGFDDSDKRKGEQAC